MHSRLVVALYRQQATAGGLTRASWCQISGLTGQLTCTPSKAKGDNGSNYHQPLQRVRGACQSEQWQQQLSLSACLGSKIPRKGCCRILLNVQPPRAVRAVIQGTLALLDHHQVLLAAIHDLCEMLQQAHMSALPLRSKEAGKRRICRLTL